MPANLPVMLAGRPISTSARLIAVTASLSATPSGEVERKRGGRELPLVRQRNGRDPLREVREGRQRNVGAFGRLHVDRLQEVRAFPPLLLQRQNHVVLIDRLVHHRDLALAESVVERGVHRLRREAEARCGIAVDDHIGRQAGILLVGADVRDLRKRREPVQNLRPPFRQRRRSRAPAACTGIARCPAGRRCARPGSSAGTWWPRACRRSCGAGGRSPGPRWTCEPPPASAER